MHKLSKPSKATAKTIKSPRTSKPFSRSEETRLIKSVGAFMVRTLTSKAKEAALALKQRPLKAGRASG